MISRRRFIEISALSGGGLCLASAIAVTPAYRKGDAKLHQKSQKLNKFLSIDQAGTVTILLSKHEMGQGTGTTIPSILADEIGADWAKVKIVNADYDPIFTWQEMGTTGGSGSIARIWQSIRETGAIARQLLINAAAIKANVSSATLHTHNNYVLDSNNVALYEFGELAAFAATLALPAKAELKPNKEFRYVGTSVKNRLTDSVLRGEGIYGMDMQIDGMVYASIEKCPVYRGKLSKFDASAALKVSGVLSIFPLKFDAPFDQSQHVQEGVVVVATSTWIAFKARKLLKIEWDIEADLKTNMAKFNAELTRARDKAKLAFELGDAEQELNSPDNKILSAEYNSTYQTHALMEPINATASINNDTCDIWVGAQDGSLVNSQVSKFLAMQTEKVRVHILHSGGSFGRRYHVDSSIEAALIAKKINLPVKVVWTREDELMHDHFHPPQRNYLSAALSTTGELRALKNIAISSDPFIPWVGVWDQYYAASTFHNSESTIPGILHHGAWRSTGEHRCAIAKECFIDELALAANKSPIDFRLQLLATEVDVGDENLLPDWVRQYMLPNRATLRARYTSVLKYIKNHPVWTNKMAPKTGRGLAIHHFGQTACAQVAEVKLDNSERGFSVTKVTAFVHCGLVVNPHFAQGQIEGAIIWALSAVYYGHVELQEGVIKHSNFDKNKVVRIDESPEIEVIFIDSDEVPSGLGEPGTPAVAPAILNAYYAASGVRKRSIPV